jgi:hypothetical protein
MAQPYYGAGLVHDLANFPGKSLPVWLMWQRADSGTIPLEVSHAKLNRKSLQRAGEAC